MGSILFLVKVGYHSRFNSECDTKRGFKNQLYIELGSQWGQNIYQFVFERFHDFFCFHCNKHGCSFIRLQNRIQQDFDSIMIIKL